jgi:hypothetical protein
LDHRNWKITVTAHSIYSDAAKLAEMIRTKQVSPVEVEEAGDYARSPVVGWAAWRITTCSASRHGLSSRPKRA